MPCCMATHVSGVPHLSQPRPSTSYACNYGRAIRRRGDSCASSARPPPSITASIDDPTESFYEEACPNTWRAPLRCDVGLSDTADVIVALGKFDALHTGHRSLVERAAEMGGHPYMLSFSGMAQVLGWPIRQPLVAPCDRPRVLASWTAACAGRAPRQRSVPFREIREMSAEEFVRILALDLGAKGVVAGVNYRFGYKAAGNADTLRQLGQQYGMAVSIVDLVESGDGSGPRSETVSSTKARKLLASGDVKAVAGLLGRCYRLVACLEYSSADAAAACALPSSPPRSSTPFPDAGTTREREHILPSMTVLNLLPGHGLYAGTLSVVPRGLVACASAHGGTAATGTPAAASPALLSTLPADLESGMGLPVSVRIGPDGVHVPEDALSAAVAAALPGGSPLDACCALYVVVDLCDALSLDFSCKC